MAYATLSGNFQISFLREKIKNIFCLPLALDISVFSHVRCCCRFVEEFGNCVKGVEEDEDDGDDDDGRRNFAFINIHRWNDEKCKRLMTLHRTTAYFPPTHRSYTFIHIHTSHFTHTYSYTNKVRYNKLYVIFDAFIYLSGPSTRFSAFNY